MQFGAISTLETAITKAQSRDVKALSKGLRAVGRLSTVFHR